MKTVYKPHFSLTIDEQLMPSKNRTKLITYMPNKPDKYGIKFWMVVDNESKYVYNILPYLGNYEKETRSGLRLADDTVLRLMQGLLDKGYNVTTDNFFTSPQLARILRKRRTTIVGTVRANRLHLPAQLSKETLQLHESSFYWNNMNKQLVVHYQCKQKKAVILLSTLHDNPSVDTSKKQKPNVIRFYNKNKCGVDIVDSMLRKNSTRCASRKWTVAVWQNMLDIAALNSWICFKEVRDGQVTHKQFILLLAKELREEYICERNIPTAVTLCENKLSHRKRQKCHTSGCTNRSSIICSTCERIFCGPCCLEAVRKVCTSVCLQCTIKT